MTVHAERIHVSTRHEPSQWTWLATGLAVGFFVPFVVADLLEVQRDVYYAIYGIATASLLGAWVRAATSPRAFLLHRWKWGVALGVLAARARLHRDVGRGREQPAGRAPADRRDPLARRLLRRRRRAALSVFPILVVYAALEPHRRPVLGKAASRRRSSRRSRSRPCTTSATATSAARSCEPVTADAIWSAPTLLTASPLGAPIAHVGLHTAAVVHSYDTDLFLPPHDG